MRSPTKRRGLPGRAAGSSSSAARAAMAATASSPRAFWLSAATRSTRAPGEARSARRRSGARRRALRGEVHAPRRSIRPAACVIDALFGAGLARDVDGAAKAIIERNVLARAGGRVLAVDVPSGVDGGTGKVRGVAVEASRASLSSAQARAPAHARPRAWRRDPLAEIGIPRRRSRASRGALVNAPAVGAPRCRG